MTVKIEGERWPERLWRDYFDAAVLLSIFVVVQALNIVDGTEEFFLGGIKDWHFLNIVEVTIRILCLVEGVFDG